MQQPADWQATWHEAWQLCQARRWRLPLWISGEQAFVHSTLATVLAAAPAGCRVGWLGAQPAWPAAELALVAESPGTQPIAGLALAHLQITPVSGQARQQVLGREFDWLVVNTQSGTDWDLVAASVGCVKAGGLWILLSAEPACFAGSANPLAAKVLSYPTCADSHVGYFHAYTMAQLVQQPVFRISARQSGWCQQPSVPLAAATMPVEPPAPYANAAQQSAVTAICKVASGHRNRPLVLTAHRGRGKSAALGMAAAQLHAAGKQRLIITAPQPAAARIALEHANTAAAGGASLICPSNKLQFWPIDRLLQELPPVDLLLVDEAAAIPTPQLEQLARHYHRIVFASTEHGYEGSGRGFQLRFLRTLQQLQPQFRQLHLKEPVRFGVGDPLEAVSFAWFQLERNEPTAADENATSIPSPSATQQTLSAADAEQTVTWYNGAQLQAEPALLAQVMALAALAHYQTTVRDLWALLDDPSLQVVLLRRHNSLLALAIISQEGNLPAELSAAVLQGKRRVQGHLAAQSLAFHLAAPELAQVASWRIQRIMVQPALQGQRLGTTLLGHIRLAALRLQINFLSTSFGATEQLAAFWQRNNFLPVRLSERADQRSNEFSVLMVSALRSELSAICDALQQEFAIQLWYALTRQHQQLDPQLALRWATPQLPAPTVRHYQQVRLFAAGDRPLADSWYALTLFFSHHRHLFPQAQQAQWVRWCWQQQPGVIAADSHQAHRQLLRSVLTQLTDDTVSTYRCEPISCSPGKN
jgi:tRNA(Met) cytidine acetyltransferase